jgi:hypothetical protein
MQEKDESGIFVVNVHVCYALICEVFPLHANVLARLCFGSTVRKTDLFLYFCVTEMIFISICTRSTPLLIKNKILLYPLRKIGLRPLLIVILILNFTN